MKEQKQKQWLITKSIKFQADKIEKAKKNGRIKELAELCRKQLDKLIAEK